MQQSLPAVGALPLPDELSIDALPLSDRTKARLKKLGYENLRDLKDTHFPQLYESLPFAQAKEVLKLILENKIPVGFSKPDWDEEKWHGFVASLVDQEIVKWSEVAAAVCGELNPPQVGTAIASNASFQKHYPPRQTMRRVMEWLYAQSGKCANCGTRLFLEADHIRSKQDFRDSGADPEDADTLDNLQLLCKRCNVIKRPSHALGGISFAPAQSVLMWILLSERPATKEEFYKLCRDHGLTMADIRFDEGWAFAEWLKKEGKYP